MQTSPQSIINKYYDSPNSCVNSLFVFLALIGKTALCDTWGCFLNVPLEGGKVVCLFLKYILQDNEVFFVQLHKYELCVWLQGNFILMLIMHTTMQIKVK